MCRFCEEEEQFQPDDTGCQMYIIGDVLNLDIDLEHDGDNVSVCYYYKFNYCPICGSKISRE